MRLSPRAFVSSATLAVGVCIGLGCLDAAHAAAPDGDVEWDGVFADTTEQFVDPVTVRAGAPLTLSVRAWADDLTDGRCVLYYAGVERSAEAGMQRTAGEVFDRWSCTVDVPEGTTEVYYRFALSDGDDTDWYDAGTVDDDWTVRGMSDDERAFYDFRLYVGLDTPRWSQGAVFYQIFPDRFFDGRPQNNRFYPEDCFWYLDFAPADRDAPECEGYDIPAPPPGQKRCLVHDDWSELPNGGPCDYFGGDLPGVQHKLGYLDDLGIDAVYLNPVFRSPSNHKYDTMSYEDVDPRFGGTAALDELTQAVHARGLKIIVDGVFNHVSDLGRFYNGWLNYGRDGDITGLDAYPATCGAWEVFFAGAESGCGESAWSGWFQIWAGIDEYDVDRDGDLAEPATHTCGWAGLEFMPEIDYGHPEQAPNSGPRTWLYGGSGASDPATARLSLAGKWLVDGAKLTEGLDGWRLDVPDNAGYFNEGRCQKTATDPTIWKGFRRAVKAVGADKYISGEIWDDASATQGLAGDWFRQRTYDAVMNYHYFSTPVSCLLTGTGVHADPGECRDAFFAMKPDQGTAIDAFDRHIAQQRRVYPAAVYLANQNMLSSHDSARIASRVQGDHRRLRLAMSLQAALPGAPMIYYGDEIGLGDDVPPAGATNEIGRATMPWTAFEGDASDAAESREHQRRLLCLRDAYPALRRGSFVTLHTHNIDKTYAFARFDDAGPVVAVFNTADVPHTVSLSVRRTGADDRGEWVDLLGGDSVRADDHVIEVPLDRHGVALLVPEDAADAGAACAQANRAPVADAGPDQTLDSGAVVVLDGAASVDPDGSPLTYRWTDEDGAVVSEDVAANIVDLPDGVYVFTLVVDDGVYHARDTVTYAIGDVIIEDMGVMPDAMVDDMRDDMGVVADLGVDEDGSAVDGAAADVEPVDVMPTVDGGGAPDQDGGDSSGCRVGVPAGDAPGWIWALALVLVPALRRRGR